jgi:RecB family endonuclease NucS
VGRLGEVTAIRIADNQWDPLVPPSKQDPDGEMGRRILVRWEMTCGPENRDQVVLLPSDRRFTSGELRATICEIHSTNLADLRSAMDDPANWVGLLAAFAYERALSDFIAAYPHRLEDGLVPHPSDKIRERIFDDRTRLDVLLLDRDGRPLIVECKQNAPTVDDLMQLRHYMKLLAAETGSKPRGILVHGGATRLHAEVASAAAGELPVEIVRYHLDVDFTTST